MRDVLPLESVRAEDEENDVLSPGLVRPAWIIDRFRLKSMHKEGADCSE
ncbi:hypothetical protein [uncultured Parabacteroides sp.]|nr:hypothetical protein [uncultured Parabacteroides sp.]